MNTPGYKEKLALAFAEVRETLQNDSNFANDDLLDAAFADMALDNAKELVKVAAPDFPEDYHPNVLHEVYKAASAATMRQERFDAARRLAAVAIHLMVRQ